MKTPDGPRENYCKPCAIPAEAKDQEDARLGRRERSKEVNVFFVYLSTATARKIAKHTTRGGAFDVSRGWGGQVEGEIGETGGGDAELRRVRLCPTSCWGKYKFTLCAGCGMPQVIITSAQVGWRLAKSTLPYSSPTLPPPAIALFINQMSL